MLRAYVRLSHGPRMRHIPACWFNNESFTIALESSLGRGVLYAFHNYDDDPPVCKVKVSKEDYFVRKLEHKTVLHPFILIQC